MTEPLFDNARDLAERLARTAEEDQAEVYLSEFIRAQWPIALALAANPALRYEPEFTDYVEAVSPIVSERRHLLEGFVLETRRPISGALEDDEWFTACERRSSIEALREVFEGSPAEGDIARNLDTNELDERMREIGEVEGPVAVERVPAGAPASHWWWWYPAESQ